jgi:hypothetical protein
VTRVPRIPIPDGVAAAEVGSVYEPALHSRIAALHAAILRLRALNAATAEVVRLRCAQQHDCYG